jgi:rhodanese-related sulfurtransferase
MRISPLLTAALLTAAGAWVNPALAAPPSIEAVAKTCKAGADPAVQGNTPPQIDKVTTVSPREAKCLIDILGSQLVVIQAMPDKENQLPNAKLVPEAASSGGGSMEHHQKVVAEYAKYTQGDKNRPLLVYCHHASCGWSPTAAKHAVFAEYKYVFWLREGNQGWGKAGYGFDVGPLDAKGLPVAYNKEVGECDYTREYQAKDFANEARREAGDIEVVQREEASDLASSVTSCMRRLKTKYEASPAVQRDVEKRLVSVPGDALLAVKKARAAVEADPASFFTQMLYDFNADHHQKTVNAARSVRNMTQTCGQFNLSIPAANSDISAFRAVESQLDNFMACFDNNRLNVRIGPADFYGNDYETGQEMFKGVERYTCSYWKGPKCVPDSAYRRWTAVFTPANNALVADALRRIRNVESDINQLRTAIENFRQRYNAFVNERNAYIEQRERQQSQQSYSAPSYSMPQPPSTPIRRPSNASAAGIR